MHFFARNSDNKILILALGTDPKSQIFRVVFTFLFDTQIKSFKFLDVFIENVFIFSTQAIKDVALFNWHDVFKSGNLLLDQNYIPQF